MVFNDNDTIIAPATPVGGALCVIRISGVRAIEVCEDIFSARKPLSAYESHKAVYGNIIDKDEVIDDVVVTLYRTPHTYTGEDIVEISAHGSRYIVQRILSAITARGVRMAEAGEFTRRAFLAGRLDLSQAEAVADIIAAESQASHAIASTQMRGSYSSALQQLRTELITISSLLELELDFSEEDVEFADRARLQTLLQELISEVETLCKSFALGNAIKQGVIVAIVGEPNVGKSTLLNRLAGENRAMVSDIAGTTRDTIEVVINIDGVQFRLVDTAGLHNTEDRLEQMGIERTREVIEKARVILWMTDGSKEDCPQQEFPLHEGQTLYKVINKTDLCEVNNIKSGQEGIRISAKNGDGIDELRHRLACVIDTEAAYRGDVIVSSQRHYEALSKAHEALENAMHALQNGLPADLLSEDLRQVMYHIGTITGEISSDDLLKNIFSKFCIGK